MLIFLVIFSAAGSLTGPAASRMMSRVLTFVTHNF
jgi:hypothetical protein